MLDRLQAFLDVGVRQSSDNLRDGLCQRQRHREDVHLACFQFGKVQNIVDDAEKCVGTDSNGVGVLLLLFVQLRSLQHL